MEGLFMPPKSENASNESFNLHTILLLPSQLLNNSEHITKLELKLLGLLGHVKDFDLYFNRMGSH
jgi:hypothetical protein